MVQKRNLNCRHRKKGRRQPGSRHPKKPILKPELGQLGQALSQMQFSKCASAKLLEESKGAKMREIPEMETIWNLGYIPQRENYPLLLKCISSKRFPVLLTLRAVGCPRLPQGSNGLPQELGMYSGNKQVGN